MKITVIIPTYNSMLFLERTVNSILASKGVDIELILVDDFSTDDTWGYIQKWKDKAILVQNNRRYGGPNHGYNVGIKMATSKLICVTDHDDVVHQDKFYLQADLLRKTNADICTSDFVNIFPNITQEVNCDPMGKIFFEKNETFKTLLMQEANKQRVFLNTMLFKNENVPSFEESAGIFDFRFILELSHNRTSCNLPSPMLYRYVHGGNLSLTDKFKRGNLHQVWIAQHEYMDEYPQECAKGRKTLYGKYGRINYLEGHACIKALLRSNINYKTIGLILTAYPKWLRKIVKKYFKIYSVWK